MCAAATEVLLVVWEWGADGNVIRTDHKQLRLKQDCSLDALFI
jgi:hypothetical protein